VSQARKMPTARAIRQHWATRLIELGKFDEVVEVMDDEDGGYCFACGFDSINTLQRAHINAKCNGGSDDVENLHMLCYTCHKDSEFVEGEAYWAWFKERTIYDRLMSQGFRSGAGFNMHSMFNKRKESA